MSGRNGAGPMGKGPMTGGGFGNCTGRGTLGSDAGRGAGRGGTGRGVCRMFQAGSGLGRSAPGQDADLALENQQLMEQNEKLRMELDTIMKRLDEMEARTTGSK